MPKIPSLPAITAPDAADELPIEDVSVTTTKKITLTVLKEWFQALTSWITTSMVADNAITTAKLDDGAVTAEKIADDAIFLGKVTKTSNFSTSNTSATQVTGQSITFTIPSGGRSVEIMVMVPLAYNATAGNYVRLGVWRGTVGSGTLIDEVFYRSPSNDYGSLMCFTATDVAPPPGSTTYNLAAQSSAATAVTLRYDFTTKGGYISAKLV